MMGMIGRSNRLPAAVFRVPGSSGGGGSGSTATATAFAYTGALQTYVVPANVTTITVDLYGASGAADGAGNLYQAQGGHVRCDITVIPGETLRVYVGGAGSGRTAGFNGGGAGGGTATTADGGAGGGATDIRRSPYALADRLAVAPGGGGCGGNGAGPNTGNGATPTGSAGLTSTGIGGGGGTNAAGGTGGLGSGGLAGSNGALGVGGDGGNVQRGGGGGGGGYYGGGGGGGPSANAGGGGGGGSGLSTGVNETLETGVRRGNGYAVIFG